MDKLLAFLTEPTVFIWILVISIYIYFKHCYTYWLKRGVPQVAPSFPFGDMASVIFRRQNMGDKIKEIYDLRKTQGFKYVGLYFFSRKALLALDPQLIKNILSKDFNYFHDRGIYYDEKNDPLSAHLFSLAGPKWKHLRAKLTPAYSPGKLRYMFNVILKCGYQMNEILEENVASLQSVEIKEILARFTTDVIGCCAFGLECNTMRDPEAEFRLMGKRAFTQTIGDSIKIVVIRSFPQIARLFGIGVFSRNVTNFFQKVVRETIEYRENNNVTRNDFLQLLIQLKNKGNVDEEKTVNDSDTNVPKLTMNEAAAQAFIFFLAGFETTSTTSSFALFELALNQDIQNRARDEIVQVLRNHKEITYDVLNELTYLETVILETMRKYPPAPVFLRKCTEDYHVPGSDVVIEKGLSVLIPAYGLHRDPDYFPDPDKFDPDRFSAENKSKIQDYTYIPFGDGPRICIGMRFAMMQIKIALAITLKNFKLTLNEKTKLPLKMEAKGIILTPVGGLWLDLEPNKKV